MSLPRRLTGDRPLVTCWSGIPDSTTVEAMANQPFDAVTLDMQHGGHSEDSVLRGIAAVKLSGKPVIVRIPVGRWDMVSRALDFGADAVIAPMINSAEDARRFAAYAKYPPVGQRSWGPTFAFPRLGAGTAQDFLEQANERTLTFAMIETRGAYEALDEILAVPGIDAIFVGPADFSIAWTNGKTLDPTLEDMMATVADIAARAARAGKPCGIYLTDTSLSARFAKMGFRLLALGNEGQLMGIGARSLLGEIEASLDK